MNKDLIKEKWFVITRLGDFLVDKDRASDIVLIKKEDPSGSIDLDNNLISCQSIDGILTGPQYEIYMKKRRGGWQCKYSYWHERNQQCAHMSYNRRYNDRR